MCYFNARFYPVWERLGFTIAFTSIAENRDLTETEKGIVFSSYYYGFAVTQVNNSHTYDITIHTYIVNVVVFSWCGYCTLQLVMY